jgi:hypothetical protein
MNFVTGPYPEIGGQGGGKHDVVGLDVQMYHPLVVHVVCPHEKFANFHTFCENFLRKTVNFSKTIELEQYYIVCLCSFW